MKKVLAIALIAAVILSISVLYSQNKQAGPAGPLDKYLQPVSITQMDWKLHLVDERLREALRAGRIAYRSAARYSFNKEINLTFTVPINELRNLSEEEQRNRLNRVVNLSNTLLVDAFPEFVRNRDLHITFLPEGNPDVVYASYRKGELTFGANGGEEQR